MNRLPSKEIVPLPEDWEERDCHDTFFEYIAHCREEMQRGAPLPRMFVARDARDGSAGE